MSVGFEVLTFLHLEQNGNSLMNYSTYLIAFRSSLLITLEKLTDFLIY